MKSFEKTPELPKFIQSRYIRPQESADILMKSDWGHSFSFLLVFSFLFSSWNDFFFFLLASIIMATHLVKARGYTLSLREFQKIKTFGIYCFSFHGKIESFLTGRTRLERIWSLTPKTIASQYERIPLFLFLLYFFFFSFSFTSFSRGFH